MWNRVAPLLLLLAALLVPRGAHADATVDAAASAIDEQVARLVDRETRHFIAEVARRGLDRFRRSVTLGPTLHAAPSMTADDDRTVDVQVGAGLALLRYDIPALPTYEQIRSILISGLTSAVVAQVRAAAERGQVLSEDEQRRLVEESWQRLKDELLAGLRPRRLEKPSMALVGELAYIDEADWDLRVLAGIGVSKLFVSAGVSFHHEGEGQFALLVPLELSLPVLLSDGLRSPVVQVFVRGDLVVASGDDTPLRLFAGARFALDVL
jgi:hypothetical protein